MKQHVILALNPFEPATWTTHDVEDIRAFLQEQFVEWPDSARIYTNQISQVTDVTPTNEAEVERLGEMEGPFYVIVYPGAPVAAWVIYAVIAVLVVAVVVLASNMTPPNSALRNTQSSSPNNELSERTNKPRPNGRIPDIYGTVRSTPDLIAVPYKLFIENQEVEYAYMCIGRGYFEVSDIRDDRTLSSDIAGTSVEIYGPYTSPNSGDSPQLSIGDPIATPVLSVIRSNSVNGQVLRAPNDQTVVGRSNIRFVSPNKIQFKIVLDGFGISDDYDFTKDFTSGENLEIINAVENSSFAITTEVIAADSTGYFRFPIPSSTLPTQFVVGDDLIIEHALFNATDSDDFVTNTYDLSGTYQITAVAHLLETAQDYCVITLDSPSTINPQWERAGIPSTASAVLKTPNGPPVFDLDGTYVIASVSKLEMTLVSPETIKPAWATIGTTNYVSPTLSTQANKWIGPFVIPAKDLTQVLANFVAPNGMYKDDGKNQVGLITSVELEVTPINMDGSSRGAVELFSTTLTGSSKTRNMVATTLTADVTFVGRCKVRARRTSNKDFKYEGSVVDEVKWRDVYSSAPVSDVDFGEITTVQSITYATEGALQIKERKLNMLVTRMIPLRVSGSTFTEELYATNSADEIISAVCLDPRIGNRQPAEIDFDSIYNAVAEVREYFGTDLAGEFSYTFDNNNLSFEETVRVIGDAIFCTAYRRGSILRMNFERSTNNSTLLFNHQNKLPASETRTVRFGNQDSFDGVSFQYVDPTDDALVTYYIPEDKTAVNPKEIESLGIRSKLQAYLHAWRIWNKVRYQNVVIEFKATQEADLLVTNDRILVADNTRSETQDGQVELQTGLVLKLSHEVTFNDPDGHSIFVQYADETVESIPVLPGEHTDEVILTRPPRIPLAVEDDFYAKTTFILVGNSDTGENAFLVTEKSPENNQTSTVRAVNYDARYYENDTDFINGIINVDGDFV